MNGAASRGGALVLWAVAASCGGGVDAGRDPVADRLDTLVARRPFPPRTALLVGIDRYADATFPPLHGCANDVRRMQATLVERFDFDPDDVFVLLDEEATHENIVTAFDRALIRRARPGTEAVFYLAGHGSRVPDRAPDATAEPDGYDSTYVAHDSRAAGRDGERDLTDDELRSLIQALVERTSRVTVVTDTCHSGGVLRGVEAGAVRAAPPGTQPLDRSWVEAFWPAGIPLTEDGPRRRLAPDRYVHVAACRREQSAQETWVAGADGRPRAFGALTHLFCQVLDRAPRDATWRSVLGEVGAQLATAFPGQSLTCSGALDRAVFGGAGGPLRGLAARVLDDGAVIVEAGALHGLSPGARLEAWDGSGATQLGRLEVQRVASTVARARWVEEAPVSSERSLRVVEKARSSARPPLRVALGDAGLGEPLGGASVEVLPRSRGPDYVVDRDASGLVMHTVEGIAIGAAIDAAAPDLEDRLAAMVASEQRWRAAFELGARRGAWPLVARFRIPETAELGPFPGHRPATQVDGEPFLDGGLHVVGGLAEDRPRSMVWLEVENLHPIDLFTVVLSVAEDRGCTPIHPIVGEPAEVLPAGGSLRLPIAVIARRDWPLERPMRDRFLVIATRRRADFELFRSESALREARSAPPAVLSLALDAARDRGPVPVDADEDWGVVAVDLLVAPPAGSKAPGTPPAAEVER